MIRSILGSLLLFGSCCTAEAGLSIVPRACVDIVPACTADVCAAPVVSHAKAEAVVRAPILHQPVRRVVRSYVVQPAVAVVQPFVQPVFARGCAGGACGSRAVTRIGPRRSVARARVRH